MASTGDGEQKAAFGFKIAGKARPKVAVNVEEKKEQRQLITGVSDSGVIPAEGAAAAGGKDYVIPKLQNTYKAGVGKFVPSFVPESTTTAVTGKAEDRYERAAVPDQPALTSFGLEVRKRKADRDAEPANGAASDRPLVPVSTKDEAAQLREDLEQLPEEASVEDYEALPVEEFGKALLRGLGWSDGQGVGRKRQVVEPKQTLRRPDRLGLGANPAAPPPDKRPRKMGDKPKQDLVAAPAADGTVRHRVGLDEKLVPRSALQAGPVVGKAMEVVRGRHAGLVCVVRELLPRQEGASGAGRVVVELKPSAEVVEVSADDLAERGNGKAAAERGNSNAAADSGRSRQEQGQQVASRDSSRERQRQRSSRDRSRSRDRHKGDSRDYDRSRKQRSRSRSSSSDRQGHSSGREQRHGSSSRHRDDSRDHYGSGSQRPKQRAAAVLPPHKLWVASLIRVRVIDKRLQGGRLYLKKGVVLDVAPDGTCDVRMEENRQVVNAHQDQLETVVPKAAGAAVMVVQGKHKGRKGRLLQVSLNSGAAALQLVGDMVVERMLLDDVAQYVGHLEEENE